MYIFFSNTAERTHFVLNKRKHILHKQLPKMPKEP